LRAFAPSGQSLARVIRDLTRSPASASRCLARRLQRLATPVPRERCPSPQAHARLPDKRSYGRAFSGGTIPKLGVFDGLARLILACPPSAGAPKAPFGFLSDGAFRSYYVLVARLWSGMPDLTSADPSDLAATLAFALRYSGRKRVHNADGGDLSPSARSTTSERAGFVVMKRPALGGGAALARGFEG
jgi:hypothetical protein